MIMKKSLLKIGTILLMGVSLSACSLLNSLVNKGGSGSKTTKMESYKNEVSLNEFAGGFQEKLAATSYASENFTLGDAVLDAALDASVSQKITNSTYANKKRSEVSAKVSASAKASYDKDNETIAFTAKDEMSGKYDNAVLGEGSMNQKAEFDFLFQQNGSNYALVNKSDKTYIPVETGEVDLNKALSSGVQMGFAALLGILPAEDASGEVEMPEGISLKYYWDKDVFTVVGDVDHAEELTDTERVYNYDTDTYEYVTTQYGVAHFNGEVKLQFKVNEVLKVRAYAKLDIQADFNVDHNSLLGGFVSISDLLTNTCVKDDSEVIKLELSAGVNFEQKKVTNKTVNLSGYKEIVTD